jgi:hypothetical protein
MYADYISLKTGGIIELVWGFIDGTVHRTVGPSCFQRLMHSGHKRCHGIKFQQVNTPDGLIALMFGPIPASRHDSYLLSVSGLLYQLSQLFPFEDGTTYCLYGDPAYPINDYIFGGYRNPDSGSSQQEFNSAMSEVRVSVEWNFGEITQYWKFLDFKQDMKVFLQPVAQYYIIASLFTNFCTILYGNKTQKYFACPTMSLQEYINLK